MSELGGTAANLAKLAYRQNPMSRGFQQTVDSVGKSVQAREHNVNPAINAKKI